MSTNSIPANEIQSVNSPKSIKIKMNGVNQVLRKMGFLFENQTKEFSNGVTMETILIQPNAVYQFQNQKNSDLTISIINGVLEGANGTEGAYNEVCGMDEIIYLPIGSAYHAHNISANEPVIAVITRCNQLVMN